MKKKKKKKKKSIISEIQAYLYSGSIHFYSTVKYKKNPKEEINFCYCLLGM